MRQASGEFAEDPCSSVKRGNMVRAARALLSAVTHLLVLADMSDVYLLLLQLKLQIYPDTHRRFGLSREHRCFTLSLRARGGPVGTGARPLKTG
ncbi:catenin alpha-1 [Tachysurus ichikawai]